MDNSQLDLSKVISVITENPDLIARIAALAGTGGGQSENAEAAVSPNPEVTEELSVPTEAAEPAVSEVKGITDSAPKNRQKLLTAFKPYLSDERAKAIDSMLSIADVLDKIRGR